jgi:tetratricopeptide (TPR) repeat protein
MPTNHNGFGAGRWPTAILVVLSLLGCSERRKTTIQGTEMRVALTDLAGAEDVYYANNLRYSADQSTIVALTLPSGVSITIDSADEHGWHASATHEYGVETCYVSGRNDGSSALASVEGPTCKPLQVSATLRDVRGRIIVPPTSAASTKKAPAPAEREVEVTAARAASVVAQPTSGTTETLSLWLPTTGSQKEDFGYPTQTIDRLAVRQALLARSYDALDRFLTAYGDSVQRDYRVEYQLFDAYGAFGVAMPTLEPRLNEWLRLRPKSVAALLARASFYRASGWSARGTALARETTSEQFQRMNSFFQRAINDLTEAHRLDPKSIVAYRLMIDMTSSRSRIRLSREMLDKALQIQPNSFLLRVSHMHNLLPRWGGSYDAMEEFADESAPFAKRNPRIKALKGFVDLDRADSFEDDGQKGDAIEAYGRALRFGDYWEFRFERGKYYSRADLDEEALEDFNAALLQHPQSDDALHARARVEYELARQAFGETKDTLFSQAFRDILMAVALDPADQDHLEQLAFYQKNIPEYAPPQQ